VSGRSGFYFSVIEPGDVEAGSEVEILNRDTNNVTVRDILRLYLGQEDDPELLHRAMKVSSLPESWKTQLRLRAEQKVYRALASLLVGLWNKSYRSVVYFLEYVFVRKVQVVFVESLGTEKETYESSSTEQLRRFGRPETG